VIRNRILNVPIGLALLGAAACAGSDNPTALADLDPQTEFSISESRVETFEEVEISVLATEGGSPMEMVHAELEIEPATGGPAWAVEMEREGEAYAAHVTFFEEGEHHLHFRGTLEGHRLEMEMGEDEVEVHRRHIVVGPYWIEIEASPAPILESTQTTVHLLVFTDVGGGPGDAVAGLEMEVEAHTPDGVVAALEVVEEEGGEYETEYLFGEAGDYELHVEVEVDGIHEDGEFHLPVLSRDGLDNPPGENDDAGGDHGH
jgi:hypothetical protein